MLKKIVVIAIFALIGWGICGAVINIGRKVTTVENTLIIHAFVVPIVFGILSYLYHRFFHYTQPLHTAMIFMLAAIVLDAGIIAPFAEKSFAMFASILGTWIPFGLIFIATYLVGRMTFQSAPKPQRLAVEQ